MHEQRKKVWIDRCQTYLIARIVLYCILYQLAVWLFIGCERIILSSVEGIMAPASAAFCFFLMAAGVVALSMVFIYDAVLFAHRIVGPLYRLRKTVRAI